MIRVPRMDGAMLRMRRVDIVDRVAGGERSCPKDCT